MVKLCISTLTLWGITQKCLKKDPPEAGYDIILQKIREAERKALRLYGNGKVKGIELVLKPELINKFKISSENMQWLESLPYNTIHGVYDKDRTNLEVEKEWYKRLNAKNITYHSDSTSQDFLKKLLNTFENVSIENMSNEKKSGKTISGLESIFDKYLGLKMALDMSHSMIPAFTSDLIEHFKQRIVEIHCSGVSFSKSKDHNKMYHIPLVDCHPLSLETLDLIQSRLPEAIYVIESKFIRKRRYMPKEMSLVDN